MYTYAPVFCYCRIYEIQWIARNGPCCDNPSKGIRPVRAIAIVSIDMAYTFTITTFFTVRSRSVWMGIYLYIGLLFGAAVTYTKCKGMFYRAQYPVRWTAQIADPFIPAPTRLSWKAFYPPAITPEDCSSVFQLLSIARGILIYSAE